MGFQSDFKGLSLLSCRLLCRLTYALSLNFLAMIHLDGHVTNINTVEQTSFTVVSIFHVLLGSCNPLDLSQNLTEFFDCRLFSHKRYGREKLYAELGWESLSLRKRSRRLTLFFRIANNLTPDYARDPIPPHQQFQYFLPRRDVIGQIRARTEKFKASFHPHCLSEWNKLKPEIRLAPSVAVFKKKLLSIIRPPPPPGKPDSFS